MKIKILFALLLVNWAIIGQTHFRHIAVTANTSAHITTLDHPLLNGNERAVLFVSPVWEQQGDNSPSHTFGVWYNGSRWTIFNENLQPMLPATVQKFQFNVLIYEKLYANTFVQTVTASNKNFHITILDNPQLNGNPNAVLLVSQKYGVYNPHEIGVWYNGSRWTIFNQDRLELPLNAQFNVLMATAGVNIAGSFVVQHMHTAASRLTNARYVGYTALNDSRLNSNEKWNLFVTQRYLSAYNPFPYTIWYDSPTDVYTGYKDGNWLIYNGLNQNLPLNTGFNIVAIPKPFTPIAPTLTGWVDMHTHPMSHLGFGGKLIHGAPDVDILVPAKSNCRQYERAANIGEALGACNGTHGGHGVFDNPCGDHFRKAILRGTESKLHAQSVHREEGATGYPALNGWPAHNDITHQQMWIDWVKRTYDNGLRIMVALTVNNVTLAAAVSGPGDRNPDDVSSSNIQIDEMKRMVARHNGSAGSVDNWMEIAYTAADIRRIVNSNRLAIILGMEVDNIGNFHKNSSVDPNNLTALSTQWMRNEIQRIHNQGVRYIFPIHLVDNKLGGTAVYEDGFNMSNYHQTGRFWDIGCASPSDGIDKKFVVSGFDIALAVAKAKIGMDIARNPPTPPDCGAQGHVNNLGLTILGEYAIKEMMKLGMIVDIDHMSKKAMDKTLEIATLANYPVNSGHNGIRGTTGSERSLNLTQARQMMTLGGLIGVGSSHATAVEFEQNYSSMLSQLGGNARLAIGTDINGFEMPPAPRAGSNVQYNASFAMCRTGSQSWDYNRVGVAHYGLMPDFFKDVNSIGSGRIFDNHLMKSAEYFAQMWEKCERQRTSVR